jgi:hypothetical protein
MADGETLAYVMRQGELFQVSGSMFQVMPKPKIKNLNRQTPVVKHETINFTPSGSLPGYEGNWNWSLQAVSTVVRERFEKRWRLTLCSRSSGRIHVRPGIVSLSGTSDAA